MFLILFGALSRFYDLDAPWKRKGHYNYGGLHTANYLHCLKQTPLAISHAIPHYKCDKTGPADFYPNHPPTMLFALWGWSSVFGESEASLRSFVGLFSVLNIVLVFLLAQAMGFTEIGALSAAAVQAVFPGTLFFGTHNDFVCEFAMFFSIAAGLLALRNRIHWACVVTIFAGVAAWPGYFGFAGLLASQWLLRKRITPVILWGALGAGVGLAMMMWLRQSTDVLGFLQSKMVHQGYVESSQLDIFYPLRWLYQAWQYHSVLLSPLFLMWLVLALCWLHGQTDRVLRLGQILAISGGGILNAIVGHQFVYIHEFNYLYILPSYALLIGLWLNSEFAKSAQADLEPNKQGLVMPKAVFGFFVLFLVSTYPYGRLQSNQIHDIFNSVLMASLCIAFAIQIRKSAVPPRNWIIFLLLAAFVNVSQLVNWRNEPSLDADFCKKASQEYKRTHSVVATSLELDPALKFYCKGVPLSHSGPQR